MLDIERIGNGYRQAGLVSTKSNSPDAGEERAIEWATRNHTTSMVQTVWRSREPSDGKVCGMRASRKTLQSSRSANAKPRTNRFVSEVAGDDVRNVVPVKRTDWERRRNMAGFMANRRVSGQ